MGNAVIRECDYRAVQDAYWEQIEFGSAPDSALNLARIVYLQRHPTVPADQARVFVDKILEQRIRGQ